MMPNCASPISIWAESSNWADVTAPLLSILIPTYDHDVVQLCAELLADMSALPVGLVELIVLVDGNPGRTGQQAVIAEATHLRQPAAWALAASNIGRSMARNCLASLARGQYLQFLDADSLPDAPGFVGRSIAELQAITTYSQPVILCGGRTGKRLAPAPADARLFERHCQKREWISPAERNLDAASSFLSANFVVPSNVFRDVPFDEAFRGWGWEDTEWALRASQIARIHHVHNSVSHMEYHRDADWLRRIERAAENYALLYERHPEIVRHHRIFPLIQIVRGFSQSKWLKSALRQVTVAKTLPVDFRLFVFKLAQALEYSKYVSDKT